MATPLILLVLSFALFSPPSSSSSDGLQAGSSLSVETAADVLTSPDGSFSAGFHPVGQNAYSFAIWFNKPSCGANNCTIVWMANRDQPVNGRRSMLCLLKSGNLVLKDAGHIPVWETKTVSLSPAYLKLEDGGNLVLRDLKGRILWQSYDSPTDTLLPLQTFNENSKLISSRSQGNYSSGYFQLYFDTDNVISLLYKGPEFSSVYWPSPWLLRWEAGRSTFNNSKIVVLGSLGNFSSTDNFTFLSADYGSKISRMLKMDFDGNIRMYSLKEDGETWVVSWQAFPQPCMVHGCCGPNSICIYIPNFGRKCSCIPGYKMKNHADWSYGCEPEFYLSCNQTEVDFLKLRHVEFYGYDYSMYPNITLEDCEKICSQLCDCKGFQFRFIKAHELDGTYCYPKTQLLNGHRPPNFNADFYVKVPKAMVSFYNNTVQDSELQCANKVQQLERKYSKRRENESLKFALWAACAVGGLEFLTICLVWCFLIRTHDNSSPKVGYLLATTGFRKFTYTELKKATNSFSEEIGSGGAGIVYKATLSDGRVAAIKRLVDANQGEAEFLAEVNTIGKLNHMNLIEMWGYCAEGKHRLLVYEYMEHGSLAESLSFKELDWKKRLEIAVGTARGLAYLHEECLEWVLHCDIKPQNILIDSKYQPKVSDFGLSWLLNRGDVKYSKVLSRIRGTRGYMAPEWVFNLPITSKVDVYSYGIVLLELATGRSPAMGMQVTDDESPQEQRTLVSWVREHMARAKETETWKHEIIDPKLKGIYDEAEMLILVTVALRCVEEDKDARPTMGEVVQLLLRHESH
ncbi:hypothetical protein CRYUN_Cryun28dG0078700 [Craigia yunnanensis]